MKKIYLCIASLAALYCNAQEYTDSVKFDDGTVIPFYLYNANEIPPKYNIMVAPMTGYIADLPTIAFTASAWVRLNEKMVVDGRIVSGYGRSSDGIRKSNDLQKGLLDIHATFNYRFGQVSKIKKRNVNLMSKASSKAGYDYTVYKLGFPAENITNYYVTGGINLLRTPVNGRLQITDSSLQEYYIGNMFSTSLMAGITRERYHYFIYSSPSLGKTRYYYYRVRNYLLLSYAPVVNYSAYAYAPDPNFDPNNPQLDYRKVEEGFVKPKSISSIGWRFGAEVKMAATALHNSPFFGVEFGQQPRLTLANPDSNTAEAETKINSFFLVIRIGVEIGFKKAEPADFRRK